MSGAAVACTLLTPLKNERDGVERLWDMIAGQTTPPGEWIILDNGSTDGTREWLEERAAKAAFPVRVLQLPGRTIAVMMNEGIRQARHEVIASCHGGTRIPREWLANLLRPLAGRKVEVVAGVWEPFGENAFERFVARSFPLELDKLDERRFLPAARSMAFTKKAWATAGGFPEWLPKFGEDTLFDLRLKKAGFQFALARDAKVGWRPKSSLRTFMRQERWYAEANALIGYLRPTWRTWLRPWISLAAFAVAGALSGSVLAALVVALALPAIDYYRLRAKGWQSFATLTSYFFWRWIMPLSEQAGIVGARLKRIEVPAADREAVDAYMAIPEGIEPPT